MLISQAKAAAGVSTDSLIDMLSLGIHDDGIRDDERMMGYGENGDAGYGPREGYGRLGNTQT